MSRTTPMWLLCKGEVSRVRDGPVSSSVPLVSVYPHWRGSVCWFGKWPCKLERCQTHPEAKVRGSQCVRRKSSQGWLDSLFRWRSVIVPCYAGDRTHRSSSNNHVFKPLSIGGRRWFDLAPALRN